MKYCPQCLRIWSSGEICPYCDCALVVGPPPAIDISGEQQRPELLTEDEVEFILWCLGIATGSEREKARRDGMLARSLIIREKLCARFDE